MLAIPPLAPETIFNIGSFPVTNAYINSTIALVLFFILGIILKNKTEEVPRGVQNFAESVLETVFKYFDQVTGERKKTLRFVPLVGTLFFFILISNWMGILPGIGSIGRWLYVHGELELVPLFRPAGSDLNLTLAMAVASVAFSHIAGILAIGFFRYANKFIKVGDILFAIKRGKPAAIMTAVVEFFVGLIEVISEFAKIASLSLRLFGNIFAGEVLLTVIGGLVAFFVPLPFLGFELLVGLIQATVFAMLVLVYLTMATAELPESRH